MLHNYFEKHNTNNAGLEPKQICCIIITYNPDDVFINLVNTIRDQVGQIIIVDNHSDSVTDILAIANEDGVVLIQNEENLGIAIALNQGLRYAAELNYEWAITFDQDSSPYNNIVEVLINARSSYPQKEDIGAIGINFPGVSTKSYYTVPEGKQYAVKDYLITSGCLMPISAWIKTGGFKEDFFIDNVDLEYSLNLRQQGKVLLITRQLGMQHKAGNPKIKKIAGINITSSNHNSFRRYYMARNHVILTKLYLLRFPFFILKLNYFFFLSIIHFLLIENEKKSKIQATVKGIKNGIFYRQKSTINK